MKTASSLGVVAVLAVMAAHAPAMAQTYPDHPIRLVVPLAAGGGTDLSARLVGKELARQFGQQVVVDNRPGGGTVVADEIVAHAKPDGYTLLMGSTTLAINPSYRKDLPYDTATAFAAVSQVSQEPYVLVTSPASGITSIRNLIARAKASPGSINFGSPGVGSGGHLAGELFKLDAGVNLTHIPYKGNGPALTDLLGGRIHLMFATVLAATPYIEGHTLRALAVTGPSRSKALPDVPTVAEAGVPGYTATSWNGILAPAGTPPLVIEKLAKGIAAAVVQPDLQRVLSQSGAEPAADGSVAFTSFIASEIAKWRQVLTGANIKMD